MKISLLHPSRGRAEKAHKTYRNWIDKSSGGTEIEYLLSLDSDDDYDLYKHIFGFDFYSIIAKNKNLVDAANNGAKICTGDLLILISDDFDCPENWDLLLLDAIKDKQDFVLKTFDGIQKWIVTLPIMDRIYYEKQGYIYHPEYQHMFCDTDLTHKADLQKRLIIRNDIVFIHNHYSSGGDKKDAVNIKADATWKQGEDFYLERCKNGFELFDNIFDLSKEANPHINWLKNKL